MNQLIASMFMRGSIYDWYAFPILLAGVVVFFAAVYWRFFIQRLSGIRARNWPTASAIIDIVSVVEQRVSTGKGDIVTYLATLTYFYRNPELQTGDYSRLFEFDEQEEARTWAASYKGSTVTVRVDPRDPSRSVLRKEDL